MFGRCAIRATGPTSSALPARDRGLAAFAAAEWASAQGRSPQAAASASASSRPPRQFCTDVGGSMKRQALWAEKQRHRSGGVGALRNDAWIAKRDALDGQVRALGDRGRWEEALSLFASVERPGEFLAKETIICLTKSLQLEKAKELFEGLPEKTSHLYAACIMAEGTRDPAAAEALMARMQAAGLRVEPRIFRALIGVYARSLKVADAERIFELQFEYGVYPNRATYQAMLTACARTGDVSRASAFIDRMERDGYQPDVGHFTSWLSSCARRKATDQARAVMQKMRERSITPDVVAYTGFLTCLRGESDLAEAEQVWNEMLEAGIEPDSYAYSALIKCSAAAEDFTRCHAIIEEVKARQIQMTKDLDLRIQEMREAEERCRARTPPGQAAPAALLPGWNEVIDPATGNPYYYHADNPQGTVTWTRPS
eukprot:TRINITY_DN91200_c0_g1_i1.p1 TRINITY_DN91200_c0_g1~~TRINITY_DN91200_c0_g1_i1.p1  ORF type:complete len:428 (+),score=74.86 TRINITY_DN91200_c0_g1_i1:52-1335(+)